MSGREVRIWAFWSFGQGRLGEEVAVFLLVLIDGPNITQSFMA